VSTVGRDEAVSREYILNQEREDQRLEQMNFVEVMGHHCPGMRCFPAVLDNRGPSAVGLWRVTSNARQSALSGTGSIRFLGGVEGRRPAVG